LEVKVIDDSKVKWRNPLSVGVGHCFNFSIVEIWQKTSKKTLILKSDFEEFHIEKN
jgi:hypothetical protein